MTTLLGVFFWSAVIALLSWLASELLEAVRSFQAQAAPGPDEDPSLGDPRAP